VYDAILAEEQNKPTVLLANQNFVTDSISARSSKGWPGLRVVSENVPPECTVLEQIRSGTIAVMDEIVAGLTRPLSSEEVSRKPKEVEKQPRTVFAGNLREVNRFFYKRGWTDGFPIIPPTEEEVAEMLTGTDWPADHLVAKIIHRLGKATIEKIAVNAVMAGALPTYMPVLIAGVQALLEPEAMFGTTEVSTGSWVPFWIINGPIRRDLHINSGQGALSPGDIANAAIGRAMGLVIKNIGGARKGVEDMGTYGNPGKYSMVTGENEEESPWEPLHVEHGFPKEDNTVTLTFPTDFSGASPYGSDANGILRGILARLNAPNRGLTVMLNAQHAKALSEEGWTKKEIAAFLCEYARVPAYQHQLFWGQWGPERVRPPLNAMDSVSILRSPENVRILVAGGVGGLALRLVTGGRSWVTKKVQLPANWDKLVAKYRDIVPTYIRY
jgi:hypothetical protein